MEVTDAQLIAWMKHENPRVRGASLDLVTSSYALDPSILNTVFEAWDLYGPEHAFHDFPLISHLPIPADKVEESLSRAAKMSYGRKITDRTCRCAGKLVEAISVADATVFAEHLPAIAELKESSKVFFRIPLASMSERAQALQRQSASLNLDFQDGQPNDISIALECLHGRGEAGVWISRGFEEWRETTERTPLAIAVLELASRHPIVGHEADLLELMNAEEASVADLATIALVRARSPETQKRIADRFPEWSRAGQLRAIDLVRRMRLPQSSNLLRFLLPYGCEAHVQDAARIAEILVFDFAAIEDWLEALLLVDEASLRRLTFAMPLAQVLAETTVPEEWPRIQHLMETRLGPFLSAGPTS